MQQVIPAPMDTWECWSQDAVAELSSSTSACVGVPLPPADDPLFDRRLECARRRLEALVTDGTTEATRVRRGCAVLLRVDALQRARADARCQDVGEYRTFRSLTERLGSLRLEDLLDVGAAHVCGAMGFARALFSSVSSSMWLPRSVFLEPALDQDGSEVRTFVTNATWLLDWAPLESEVVRRRSATLVDCAKQSHRTFRPLMEVTRAQSYVVAPVRARGRVIGLLHGDRWEDSVDHEDLGRLEAYAQSFGAAVEHAATGHRLRLVATRAAEALTAAAADIAAFDGATPYLTEFEARRRPEPTTEIALESDPVAAARLAELSPREFDVLVEMSRGLSNAEIAARLCVTEGTVKSHVKNLLRKLKVHSRAAATAILTRHEACRSRRTAP